MVDENRIGRCPHCGRGGISAKLSLTLEDYPEILAGLRAEIAAAIREDAQGEPQAIRDWAERVAAGIETGLR